MKHNSFLAQISGVTSQPTHPQPTSPKVGGAGVRLHKKVSKGSCDIWLYWLKKRDFERGAIIYLYNIIIEIFYLKNKTMCRVSIAASVCPFVSILTTLQVIVDRANAGKSRKIHIWMSDGISPLRTKYIHLDLTKPPFRVTRQRSPCPSKYTIMPSYVKCLASKEPTPPQD